jgi:uncharacterized membrane protein
MARANSPRPHRAASRRPRVQLAVFLDLSIAHNTMCPTIAAMYRKHKMERKMAPVAKTKPTVKQQFQDSKYRSLDLAIDLLLQARFVNFIHFLDHLAGWFSKTRTMCELYN